MAHRSSVPDETWDRFRSGDASARDEIIVAYFSMVKALARKLAVTLPGEVDFDDLVQEGAIGLMGALSRFDPENGASFDTYAHTRINGAMADYLRRIDFLPRSVRKKSKELESAIVRFESRMGRPPNESEIASATGLPVPEVRIVQEYAETAKFLSLESSLSDGDGVRPLPDEVASREFMSAEWQHDLVTALAQIPPDCARLLQLMYVHEVPITSISDRSGRSYGYVLRSRDEAVSAVRQLWGMDSPPRPRNRVGPPSKCGSCGACKRCKNNQYSRAYYARKKRGETGKRGPTSKCGDCGECERCERNAYQRAYYRAKKEGGPLPGRVVDAPRKKPGPPSRCGSCGECRRCKNAAYQREYARRKREEAKS